jgi:hypothetical protein
LDLLGALLCCCAHFVSVEEQKPPPSANLSYRLQADCPKMQDMLSDFCLDSSVIDETYQKYGASLRRLSLLIHEYKEIAFQEYKSTTLSADFVEEAGFLVDRGIAGDQTAFVATFSQGNGPVVSFNAVTPFSRGKVNSRNMTPFLV